MKTRVADRVETRHDPVGRPWASLKPATLERNKGHGDILHHTCELLDSRTHRARRDFVEVGFSKP